MSGDIVWTEVFLSYPQYRKFYCSETGDHLSVTLSIHGWTALEDKNHSKSAFPSKSAPNG